MTVRQFIIDNGIEALNGKAVIECGLKYKIKISQYDIENYSVEAKVNYGLSADATDEHGNLYSIFVYPSTELVE